MTLKFNKYLFIQHVFSSCISFVTKDLQTEQSLNPI